MGRKRQAERALQRKPHFFKVLLGDFAQRLKMPPNFLKHLSNEASKTATLEGPNGCSWPVRIKKSSNGTFLSTGWPKFVEDHFLKEREFLVFRYEGNMHFSIQVFDTTACEREDLFAVRPYKKLNLTKARKKRGKRVKRPLDVICHTEHQETKSGRLEFLTDGNHEAKHLQDDIINSIEGNCITSLTPNEDGKTKPEAKELQVQLIGSETTREIGHFSRRRAVTTEERSRTGEAARSFSSEFPFVIIHMSVTTIYQRYLMRFPLCFSRKHLPRERVNINLRDPNGKSWTVAYVPGERDQRDRLSMGWAAFSLGNNLEEGEIIVLLSS